MLAALPVANIIQIILINIIYMVRVLLFFMKCLSSYIFVTATNECKDSNLVHFELIISRKGNCTNCAEGQILVLMIPFEEQFWY